MKPLPITTQTLRIVRNVIWFEAPGKALADPVRFMAYAVTYALPEDMRVIRRYVSDDDFREALDNAPAGIVDPRSWAYWNSKMGRYPPPPLPSRQFGVAADPAAARDQENHSATRAQDAELEDQRRHGSMAWLRMREWEPKLDLQEDRRRAREELRAKYGPKGEI